MISGGGESDAGAGGVADEAGIGERLDHGGGSSGNDVHEVGEAAHGDHGAFGGMLLEIKLFEVVFDGTAGHGEHLQLSRSKNTLRRST